MTGRARSFGAEADAYDRHRLGYPDEVADAVLAHAAGPVRTALEIGAGTGKATRLLVDRGIAVTATDPDPAMLAVLERELPGVTTRVGALEDLVDLTDRRPGDGGGGPSYDLVVAAACLHWTEPTGRWDRVATLLRPGGTFASFGGPLTIADRDLAAAVDRARAPWVVEDRVESPDGTAPDAPVQWPGTELLTDERFTDVRQVVVERRLTLSSEELIAHQATVSAYLQLSAADRDLVFERIRGVLPACVEMTADVTLHLARRREREEPAVAVRTLVR